MKRILIAALVGGIILFVVSAAMHMSPIGMFGLKTLANDDAVRAALKDNIPDAGLYFFPGPDPANPKDMKAWEERMRSGPSGLLAYRPIGETMMARQMIVELIADIFAAFIAALFATHIAASYGKRVVMLTLLAVFTWLLLSVSYWNWWGFSLEYTLNELFMEIVPMIAAAFAIAKIVPPRPAT